RNLIREGKAYMIPGSIQTGGQLGMVTMDANLAERHLQKAISFETGIARSVDARVFEHLVTTGGLSAEEGGAPVKTLPVRSAEGGRGGPPAIGRSGRVS